MSNLSAWLSDNPDRAWGERFFVIYSPIWIVAVAAIMLSGWVLKLHDPGLLVFSMIVAAPLVVYPLIARRHSGVPWYRSYWFLFNLWIAIYVFAGSYVGSHYFFDVLGMRYRFPVSWNLDAALVGKGTGEVPIFLYVLTQAYFVTYHTVLVMIMRRLGRATGGGRLAFWVGLFFVSYLVAYAETLFMAHPSLADVFWYTDRARMLKLGSIFYATYFVISVPFLMRLGERGNEDSIRRVVVEALAASMLMFYALDVWTQFGFR